MVRAGKALQRYSNQDVLSTTSSPQTESIKIKMLLLFLSTVTFFSSKYQLGSSRGSGCNYF